MPLDVLGRTRATLTERGLGNLVSLCRAGDRWLQLSILNEEFLVSASHQLALITSLPFVHTARRYYRLTGLARTLDWGPGGRQRLAGILREAVPIWSITGSKSRNKVSIGEPAEGSLLFQFRLFAFHLLTSCLNACVHPVVVHGGTFWGLAVHNPFRCFLWSCLSVNMLWKKSMEVCDQKKTTSNGGSLGLHVDEDRSKVRHSVANCRIQ